MGQNYIICIQNKQICAEYAEYLASMTKKLVKEMARILAHRGPDDEGFYFDTDIGLGHRRLSVIDIEGSHQPIHNEDESIWVIHNGEIYNFLELREEYQ